MKYITKFILILSFFYLIILSAVAYIWFNETNTIKAAKKEVVLENKILLSQLIDLTTSKQKTGVYDYTFWDELVEFSKNADPQWAKYNLVEFLKNYDYDYIFVYNSNAKLIYTTSHQTNVSIVKKQLDLSKLDLKRPVFIDYYFLADGIPAKAFQAPIQPSEDSHRVHKPYGYLIGVKLLDKSFMEKLEELLNQTIILSLPHQKVSCDYVLPLLDSKQNTIAQMQITLNDSYLYKTINNLFLKIGITLLSIIFFSLLIFYWLLTRQILLPLQKLSIIDTLTDVYNRRYFNEIVPRLLENAKRENKLVNFVMLDIDHFKDYNDHYGHQQGDEILRIITKKIHSHLNRANDYIFRLGGEEFAVIFESDTSMNAHSFALLLKKEVEALLIPSCNNRCVTISLGLISKSANVIKDVNQLYKEADDLLYKAKSSGRNCLYSNIVEKASH